jgi:hypothetical protein
MAAGMPILLLQRLASPLWWRTSNGTIVTVRTKGKDPMAAKWGFCVFLVMLFALASGCRTPRPELKPNDYKKEDLNEVPTGRWSTAEYPKAAFDPVVDPGKAAMDAKTAGGVPGRGGMGGMGGGGMGGGRGY